jgi:hypothetical protein
VKVTRAWYRENVQKLGGSSRGSLIKEGTENAVQAEVIRWAADNEHRYPELALLFAIANGGGRTRAQAAELKLTGVKSGVPDLCLPVARGGYHGLYIEEKREPYRDKNNKLCRGTVSPEQKRWIALLREQGYRVELCEGARPTIALLEGYLSGKVTQPAADG